MAIPIIDDGQSAALRDLRDERRMSYPEYESVLQAVERENTDDDRLRRLLVSGAVAVPASYLVSKIIPSHIGRRERLIGSGLVGAAIGYGVNRAQLYNEARSAGEAALRSIRQQEREAAENDAAPVDSDTNKHRDVSLPSVYPIFPAPYSPYGADAAPKTIPVQYGG